MPESTVAVTPGAGALLHSFSKVVAGSTVQDEVVVLGEQGLPTFFAGHANNVSVATAASHVYQLMAGATNPLWIRRIRVWQVVVATTAAFAQFQVLRLTTAGSGGTTHTPGAFDQTDGASGATAQDLPTSKGTEGVLIANGVCAFVQTVPTGGPGTLPLLFDWDFDRLRAKGVRIPSGTSNGLCVKNVGAIAGASVITEIIYTESSY